MKKKILLPVSCALLAFSMHATEAVWPSKPDKLQVAVEHVVKRMFEDQRGFHVGMDIDDVADELDGAADLLGNYFIPLRDTDLAPKGNWNGIVNAIADEESGDTLETYDVVLLSGKYDKRKMTKFLEEVGEELGTDLIPDEDDPHLLLTTEGNRGLWVSLGDEIIVLSVDEYVD